MNDATHTPKTYWGTDQILEEMWDIKDKLSAARGHDVHRLFAEAREREKVSGHRVVNLQEPRKKQPHGGNYSSKI